MALNLTRNETKSREATERENTTREVEYVYEEQDALAIPKAVQERFDRNGFGLRWLRVSLKGNDDYINIGKKLQEGYVFVEPDEVPELVATSYVREEGRYEGTVCRGDLVLAKAPRGLLDKREEYYAKKTRDLMNAVDSQLESASDSKMPISNNSKSTVTRSRTPSFGGE